MSSGLCRQAVQSFGKGSSICNDVMWANFVCTHVNVLLDSSPPSLLELSTATAAASAASCPLTFTTTLNCNTAMELLQACVTAEEDGLACCTHVQSVIDYCPPFSPSHSSIASVVARIYDFAWPLDNRNTGFWMVDAVVQCPRGMYAALCSRWGV